MIVGGKKGPGRPKKDSTAVKRDQEQKPAVTKNLNNGEASLPDDIDAELDIEVETDGDITLDALTTELDDAPDAMDVDDLAEDFEDDDFSDDSADEADEDLDLTEDLSEELGTEKFFRETEPHAEDDEEEIPRSW